MLVYIHPHAKITIVSEINKTSNNLHTLVYHYIYISLYLYKLAYIYLISCDT